MHENTQIKFNLELHKKFIEKTVIQSVNEYNSFHTQVNSIYIHGIYWILCCSSLLNFRIDELIEKSRILEILNKCENEVLVGDMKYVGYSPNPFEKLSPTILATLSGIQVFILINGISRIEEKYKIMYFIKYMLRIREEEVYFLNSIQEFEQIDIRFIYSALSSMYLLNSKKPEKLMQELPILKILLFIENLQNVDGGFGRRPKDESHAGYTFCALASIALIQKINRNFTAKIKYIRLKVWLKKRIIISKDHKELYNQNSFCFNGRPNKSCDVCYSWWVIASFRILEIICTNKNKHSISFLDSKLISKLLVGILSHQNLLTGGFQKTPYDCKKNDNIADPLHTFLSISAIAILLHINSEKSGTNFVARDFFGIFDSIIKIDPIFVLPSVYL